MSNALSQIPEAVAAASILLTVYYLGRRGQTRFRSESWSGRSEMPGRRGHALSVTGPAIIGSRTRKTVRPFADSAVTEP